MEHDMLVIDHVLIAVDNLENAKKEYEGYGFTIVYGGSEAEALNALIFLKDGTLIELIGKDRFPLSYKLLNTLYITRLFGTMKDRIAAFSKVRSGFFNYSIYSKDLDLTYDFLKTKEINVSRPKAFKRKRDDGVIVKWELIGTKPFDLPFIIGDYTPARVWDSSYLHHRNNAIALYSITVETSEFDSYLKLYNILYKQEPEIDILAGKRIAYYKLNHITLVLAEADSVSGYFGKRDRSATRSFSVKCAGTTQKYPVQLTEFLKLEYDNHN